LLSIVINHLVARRRERFRALVVKLAKGRGAACGGAVSRVLVKASQASRASRECLLRLLYLFTILSAFA
jgi:hypothetical protein